jgi:hypothetical protein
MCLLFDNVFQVDEIVSILQGLSSDTVTWGEICSQYPAFVEQQSTKEQQ